MIVLALLLGAAQPCMPVHACPTRREIERAYRRWVERSIANYLDEQSKSGDIVTATAAPIRQVEQISCLARSGDDRAAARRGPVQCRFTIVNKSRRLTYVAAFSHHGDLWEIDTARTVAVRAR